MEGEGEANEECGSGGQKDKRTTKYCEKNVELEAEVRKVSEAEEKESPGQQKTPTGQVVVKCSYLGTRTW